MSDTLCAKLVRGTSVRVLPKCSPMIVYKKEKFRIYSSFTREAAHREFYRVIGVFSCLAITMFLLKLIVYFLIPKINFMIKK